MNYEALMIEYWLKLYPNQPVKIAALLRIYRQARS